MSRSIAVLGAGAIGSSVGADLTEAGEDVVLIDPWPAHVEAMRNGGLRVVMPDLDLETLVRALHIGDWHPSGRCSTSCCWRPSRTTQPGCVI